MKRGIFGILIVAFCTAWWYLAAGPGDQSKVMLMESAGLFQVSKPLHPLECATRAAKLVQNVDSEVTLIQSFGESESTNILKRREIQNKLLTACTSIQSFQLDLSFLGQSLIDETVRFQIIVNALGSVKGETGEFLERHRAEADVRLIEGNWRIVRIKFLDNLRE